MKRLRSQTLHALVLVLFATGWCLCKAWDAVVSTEGRMP